MFENLGFDPLAHLAAIVQFSDDAIVSKTLEGIITSWNRGAERLFGYAPDEAVGRSIRMIIPHERWPEEDDVLARICRGEVVDHFETMRLRRGGGEVAISLTVSPIRDADGTVVGASKIARDISQRREIERQRAALLVQAEAANRAKDQFLAVLSHELRTPLNAILGWSEVLRQTPRDSATFERGLLAISRNVKAQAKLIDDLLDISRISSGNLRMEVRPVDLGPIVEATIEAIGPAVLAKRIQLRRAIEPNTVVLGDPGRLQQTLWNLLSNAVKFTPAGGRVEVRLASVGSQIEVSVTDSGLGIEPDYLPHVFDRFSQADSSMRRQHGGLGLGLSIARELVQLHGGTLEAHSEGIDRGASFVIRLPRSVVSAWPGGDVGDPADNATSVPPPPPLPDLSGILVLVVDDDAGSREVTEAILRSLGAEVSLAASAAAARQALAGQLPDVLVADVGMPVEDGYSLLRSLRTLPAAAGGAVPAIALTALAGTADRSKALEAGFQLHLAKPVAPRSLAVAVAHLAGVAGEAAAAGAPFPNPPHRKEASHGDHEEDERQEGERRDRQERGSQERGRQEEARRQER